MAQRLRDWIAAGAGQIGEVSVVPLGGERFVLTHWEEREIAPEHLEKLAGPLAARRLVMHDEKGEFRPLKTAPNLRRGWRLELEGEEALLLALDIFYPAAFGLETARQEGRLDVVPLRETLERQTGMYAVTKKVSEEQAREVVAVCCDEGCLKTILWPLEAGGEKWGTREVVAFPLWCNEGCNLLVGKIREAMKRE